MVASNKHMDLTKNSMNRLLANGNRRNSGDRSCTASIEAVQSLCTASVEALQRQFPDFSFWPSDPQKSIFNMKFGMKSIQTQ